MAADSPAAARPEGGENMTTPLDLVVGKLRAAGCDPSSTVTNSYQGRVPVHRGSRKNLSVGVGEDGRVLLNCHHADANGNETCSPESIVDELGLRMADLWPPKPDPGGSGKTSGKKSWK